MSNTTNIISFIDFISKSYRKSIQIVIKICQDMLLSLQKYLIILLNSNKKIWIMYVPRAIKFEFRQHKNYTSSKKIDNALQTKLISVFWKCIYHEHKKRLMLSWCKEISLDHWKFQNVYHLKEISVIRNIN